jgi:hypothetical protein
LEQKESPGRAPRTISHLETEARHSTDKGHCDIIVDAAVDGTRYLLVRSPQAHCISGFVQSSRARNSAYVRKRLPNKTIADVLEIRPWTVSTHLRRVFAKLHVSSRAAMAARLISDGIVKDFTYLKTFNCATCQSL